MDGVYHVVCHDCQFEGIYGTATAATDARERHERETAHQVSHLEISRPKPATDA